ncbi:phage tail protein I [Castellaniella denitrificans]|uniref:phage tail protein I n=1 Tax=Castellaniella denitrificans TaxID=56119 RepID=UPI00360A6A48
MSLLPYNATAFERALDAATPLALPTPIADLWNPDTCPRDALPWLAWALHVDNWEDAATESQQRDAIRMSVLLHRKKGTPWALKRALSTLGLGIELIDQHEQQVMYAQYNPPRLDGTWKLDGSRKIMPLSAITGIPQVQHWAQFIVRLNLADVSNPAVLTKLRALVEEWKPQRSWPLFTYLLRIYFTVTIGAESHFVMQKRVHAPIWSGLTITTRPGFVWKLGRNGTAVKLGQFKLDGSVQIGKLYGAVPGPKLKSARVESSAALAKYISIDTRPRQRLGLSHTVRTPDPVTLHKRPRKLDGTWKVGTGTKLGQFKLDGTPLPRNPMTEGPRLGRFKLRNPAHDIPDPAYAGRVKLDGTWKVGGPAQPDSRIVSTRIPDGIDGHI